MKKYSHFLLAFFAVLCIVFSSCLKDSRNIPNTPAIEFSDFIQYPGDTADLIFKFKDGDGDIGLSPSDTTGKFALSNSKGEFYYNLHMIYYYKGSDNLFHRFFNVNINDSQQVLARIPNITPVGQNKILDGEIKFRIDPPYWFPTHTTIKFDVYIYDRDLNKSNVITTPELVTPG